MSVHTLFADSGSTKTDWALCGQVVSTQGINPLLQDDDAIIHILNDELQPQLTSAVSGICFFGSGVILQQQPRMEKLLRQAFPHVANIEAHSDLLGAARALLGNTEGIACILGTGSNSCLYDGRDIVSNTPALGYVLGDEGGGARLAIRLLNALYKDPRYAPLRQVFEHEMCLTMASVIDHVYRQPLPNRWLASLSPFVHNHLDHPLLSQLVTTHFRSFLQRNVEPYGRRDLPVSAVGSLAAVYTEQWTEALAAEGFLKGNIMKSPIEAFVLVP